MECSLVKANSVQYNFHWDFWDRSYLSFPAVCDPEQERSRDLGHHLSTTWDSRINLMYKKFIPKKVGRDQILLTSDSSLHPQPFQILESIYHLLFSSDSLSWVLWHLLVKILILHLKKFQINFTRYPSKRENKASFWRKNGISISRQSNLKIGDWLKC